MIDISIITVVMNHLPFIREMLRSLYGEGMPKATFETIIVDNCSTDGSFEFVRDHYPEIRLIRNEHPFGFARNNNIGAAQASGKYILILNPDIILSPGTIDGLHRFLESHAEAGIVAPRLENPDGSLQFSVRRFPTLRILLSRILTRGDDSSDDRQVQSYLLKDLPHDRPTPIDWCMGASFLIPSTLYRQLAGFDEGFFLYVEDMDLCYRCWQSGHPVIYLPTSAMTHVHQRSSMHFNKKTYIHLRSFWHFFYKNRFRVKSFTSKGEN